MTKTTISIDELIISKKLNQDICLKVRVVNKSHKMPTQFGSKFEYFFMDFMDRNGQIRGLFYIGHATSKPMNGFFNNVNLDDIIFISGFIVEKSDGECFGINKKKKLKFERIVYEKLTIEPQIYSLQGFPSIFIHGQIIILKGIIFEKEEKMISLTHSEIVKLNQTLVKLVDSSCRFIWIKWYFKSSIVLNNAVKVKGRLVFSQSEEITCYLTVMKESDLEPVSNEEKLEIVKSIGESRKNDKGDPSLDLKQIGIID